MDIPTVFRLVATMAAAYALAGPVVAHAQRIPAGFESGERALDALIEFPELRGDADQTIVCAGILKKNGKLDQAGCYVLQPGDEIYAAAVAKALRKSRFTPASVDGREMDVVFQYRARFRQQGEERSIFLYANPGYSENLDAYGPDHVAAQRSMTRERWQKACPQHSKFTVMAKAHVSHEGIPSSISVSEGSGLPVTQKCRDAIAATLAESVYVPAMADGEPVPSTYVEPFGN